MSALDFRRPCSGGRGSEAAYKVVRGKVTRLIDDRPLYPDIDACTELVRNGSFVEAVESAIGDIRL
jgi:histidine ammonia-lyase